MPRNVRNFWLELNVDGSKKAVETGPRASDGGFDLLIRMRSSGGGIFTPVSIHGWVEDDGRIVLSADWNGTMLDQVISQR